MNNTIFITGHLLIILVVVISVTVLALSHDLTSIGTGILGAALGISGTSSLQRINNGGPK